MTSSTTSFEVNFDGLVGPTHNYGGLAVGNLASGSNAGQISQPKKAALQGLAKMKAMADLGVKQAVLPPHDRPHLSTLRHLGFTGRSDADLLANAFNRAPEIAAGVYSASNMWVANAATVSPFADTGDGKTHFTVANLSSMFHRSIEAPTTERILRSIFSGAEFSHHQALAVGAFMADEGAANHTRFCSAYGEPGVEFFVYGARAFDKTSIKPARFPARQTLEASQAIARNHRLANTTTVFAQQNPAAIDGGVFHNDVIAVGDRNLLFYHEQAFLDTDAVRKQLDIAYGGLVGRDQPGLIYIEVPSAEVPLQDAVNSYLFNSQLVQAGGQSGATIIVPSECQHVSSVHNYLQWLESDHPGIDAVHYFDVKQSMRNGGGPACLRLRVVLTQEQIDNTQARVFLDHALYHDLCQWVERHYRDTLAPADLLDPQLMEESFRALDELSKLLKLPTIVTGPIYDFQR